MDKNVLLHSFLSDGHISAVAIATCDPTVGKMLLLFMVYLFHLSSEGFWHVAVYMCQI